MFNDRLVLGLKGTMSEAELHVLRARLDGGIRNKAARGELRRGLPVGLVWGERTARSASTRTRRSPASSAPSSTRFAELRLGPRGLAVAALGGPALPVRSDSPPSRSSGCSPPTSPSTTSSPTPAYAGAYAYGKTRQERYVDQTATVRQRTRQLPRAEWAVLIPDHHPGFIDWETYLANQERIGANTRPGRTSRRRRPRGRALLQGLAVCGRCGRSLRVSYHGRNATPAYYCAARRLVEGAARRHLRVGGQQIDAAVAAAFLAACTPAGLQACLAAAEQLEAGHDAALTQRRRQVERARYEATRAERRYRAVDPEHRLVARGLEREWEQRCKSWRRPKPSSPAANSADRAG